MKQFNNIEYDEEKKTLDVGGGVTWGDVYTYLQSWASDYALGAVGGDPATGVSGWLLGGGYSVLTNRFGLGIDNIVGFRVLLPGRAVSYVSLEENPEIFKALKVRSSSHNLIACSFTFDWEGRRA